MKNTLTTTKVTLLSLLIASSAAVAEISSTKPLLMNGFKIAVIKNFTGTKDIISGNYLNSISIINSENKQSSGFEKSMGLCVANLKVNRLAKAELACTRAIEAISAITADNKHNRYLKSLAYSNRGIVRYKSNSTLSAIEDFTTALKLSKHRYIKDNISALKTAIASNYSVEINNTFINE
jgi:hypothetical protein